MFWIVYLYLVVSVIPAVFNLFNDVALGLSTLFGSLLAVFAGGGLRGSLYGNKGQKIGGFVSAVIFILIAYWLSDKFYFAIKGFSFTGLEWIIIGFFIGLLFVSKTVALGRDATEWIKLSAQDKKLAVIKTFKEVANTYYPSEAIPDMVVQYKKKKVFDGFVKDITQGYKETNLKKPYQEVLHTFVNKYLTSIISSTLQENKLLLIKPKETIEILDRLSLNNKEFRQIHHLKGSKGENETVESHIDYLTNKQQYKNTDSNNYIVGMRLVYLEELEKYGIDRKISIKKCKTQYSFN